MKGLTDYCKGCVYKLTGDFKKRCIEHGKNQIHGECFVNCNTKMTTSVMRSGNKIILNSCIYNNRRIITLFSELLEGINIYGCINNGVKSILNVDWSERNKLKAKSRIVLFDVIDFELLGCL